LQARLANIPGAPPPEPAAPVEAPPSWAEISETDDYKSLDYPSQVDLARKWGEQSKQYAATLPGYNDEQAAQIDDFVINDAVEVPANIKRASAAAGLVKGAAQGIGALAGGIAGAPLGPAGVIAGGVGGMVLAGETAEAGLQKFVPAVAESRKFAPGYATAGEYAPSVAMGAIGVRGLATAGKAMARELGTKKAVEEIAKTAAVSGVVGGGVGTATRAVLGAEVTPRTVAEDVLFGALFAGLGSGARVQGYNREQALNLNERVKSGRASEAEYRDWQGILAEAERTQARGVESAKRTEVELGGRPVFQKTELTQRPQPEMRPVPTGELPAPRPQIPELPEVGVRGAARGTQADTAEMQRRGVTSEMQETLLDLNDPVPVRKTFSIESQGINREAIIPVPRTIIPPPTRGPREAELVREGEIITPRRVLPTTQRPALPERAEVEVPAPTTEPAAPVGGQIKEDVGNINWNAKGIGGVPDQENIDYFGFTIPMSYSDFRLLAAKGNWDKETIPYIENAIKEGKEIAPPFLQAKWDGKKGVWKVSSHEGRSRSDAVNNLFPNSKIPVNIFPSGMRGRDVTPEMRSAPFVSESGEKIITPGSVSKGQPIPRPMGGKGGEAGFIISDPAEKARDIAQRWATSRGDLPKEAFDILEAKDQRIQAMQKQVDFTLRDLAKATVEANGKRVLTEPQKAIIDSYMRGQSDVLPELPEPLQAPVAQMRRQLDNLTERLVESNVFTGPKAEAVLARRGEYVTRSYEKYDNPRFGFELLQKRAPDRLESAIKFLQNEIIAAEPGISVADARQRAIGKAKEISTPEEGFSFDSLVNAANLGKDLSITKKRKDIPEEIRFLLGEYEDPIINYARSAVKMINLLQSQRTLADLRDWGVSNGLFFDKPTGNASQIIAAEGSKTLEPLNGLYAEPELVNAIKDFDVMVKGGDAYKLFSAINAWVKWGKTVGSIQAQFRNPLSNIVIEIMNGNFAFTGRKEALSTILSEFGVPAVDSPAMRQYVTRATQLGVLDTTVLNEFYQTLRDAQRYKGDTMSFAEDLSGKSLNAAKKGIMTLNRLYRSGDNFFKIMAWESETKALMQGKGLSRQDAEVEAAERVKNTRPTYSRVFRIIKKWRNQPLFGQFMSWPSEILRTTANSVRYGAEDLKTPGMRSHGFKRLIGMIVGTSIGIGIVRAFMWATGFNDRKVGAMRRFVAPYQKNALLAPTGIDGKGNVGYVDISYTDPLEVFRGPILAAASGNNFEEGLLNSTREFLETYLGPSILVNSLASAIYGKTPQNREIRNPQDPALDQAYDTLTYFLRQNEPATVSQFRRVYKALRGEPDVTVSKYGRIYKPGEEISAIFGIRPQSIDLGKALEGKSARFASSMSDVGRIFTETYGAAGKVPEADIRSQYAKMEDRRKQLFDEANKDFHAAMLLGMDRGEAIRAMSVGMGRANATAVASNRYRDYKVGKALRQQMQKTLAPEEISRREAVRRDIEVGVE
jgi:hypothetical protein